MNESCKHMNKSWPQVNGFQETKAKDAGTTVHNAALHVALAAHEHVRTSASLSFLLARELTMYTKKERGGSRRGQGAYALKKRARTLLERAVRLEPSNVAVLMGLAEWREGAAEIPAAIGDTLSYIKFIYTLNPKPQTLKPLNRDRTWQRS